MCDVPTLKPFVIPIFIPHAGCPHRCVFCNQTRTTSRPEKLPTADQLDETIDRFLGYRKDSARYTEISFYGGNFLGLPTHRIVSYLEHVSRYIRDRRAHGIRFSTRPDTITARRLDVLSPFPVSTVELGVQSMNNSVLETSRRGHTAEDVHNAMRLIKRRPYRLGLQMMIGLPGDTAEKAMSTGRQLAGLGSEFVRIYPTLVLSSSRLAHWHRQGRYTPMTLDEAVALTQRLYMLFHRRGINVIRMGLQATDGLDTGTDRLAGPYHPAFGELVHSAIWLNAIRKTINNNNLRNRNLIIEVPPKWVSRVRGLKNQNITILSKEFRLPDITVSTNNRLPRNTIRINGLDCAPEDYS